MLRDMYIDVSLQGHHHHSRESMITPGSASSLQGHYHHCRFTIITSGSPRSTPHRGITPGSPLQGYNDLILVLQSSPSGSGAGIGATVLVDAAPAAPAGVSRRYVIQSLHAAPSMPVVSVAKHATSAACVSIFVSITTLRFCVRRLPSAYIRMPHSQCW